MQTCMHGLAPTMMLCYAMPCHAMGCKARHDNTRAATEATGAYFWLMMCLYLSDCPPCCLVAVQVYVVALVCEQSSTSTLPCLQPNTISSLFVALCLVVADLDAGCRCCKLKSFVHCAHCLLLFVRSYISATVTCRIQCSYTRSADSSTPAHGRSG
jgi:hypothetical protein